MPITKINKTFDVDLIQSDLERIIKKYGWNETDQLCFNHPKEIIDPVERLYLGADSLWNYKEKKFNYTEQQFTVLNNELHDTYLEEIFNYVKETYGPIGRFRAMKLKPKSCLSLHIDFDNPRYHIPVITNENCFFIHFADEPQINYMSDVGCLYKFDSRIKHTAINASKTDRIHLVFSGVNNASNSLN